MSVYHCRANRRQGDGRPTPFARMKPPQHPTNTHTHHQHTPPNQIQTETLCKTRSIHSCRATKNTCCSTAAAAAVAAAAAAAVVGLCVYMFWLVGWLIVGSCGRGSVVMDVHRPDATATPLFHKRTYTHPSTSPIKHSPPAAPQIPHPNFPRRQLGPDGFAEPRSAGGGGGGEEVCLCGYGCGCGCG